MMIQRWDRMRQLAILGVLLLSSSCAHLGIKTAPTPPTADVPTSNASTANPASGATPPAPAAPADATATAMLSSDAAEEADDDDDSGPEEEGESHDLSAAAELGIRYTADLSDAELARRWTEAPESLGSISLGFVDEGRLLNAAQFPTGEAWTLVSPHLAWATKETIDYVVDAINAVRGAHPNAPPLRVNQLSSKEGGYLRPHKSHQNGRDVDLGFYYRSADPVRVRARERYIDVALNWALIKAIVTRTDVQFILVDRRVQKVIYDYALKSGEDKAWLDTLFKAGKASLVKHARRHRDHFHVRFYNGRAQELGRRVAPLLAERPEQNLAMHRVRRGDTLGAIAHRYATSVAAIRKVNGLRSKYLRVAQVLKVPLRKPCTRCPVPPAVVVPERRLPPMPSNAAAPLSASAQPVETKDAVGTSAPVVTTTATDTNNQAPAAGAPTATATANDAQPSGLLPKLPSLNATVQ